MAGRPSAFDPSYCELARNYCLLGATDADLARFFDVAEATINNWKKAHPEFLESLKAGKEQADAIVAEKLFRRATGYSHKAVKIALTPAGESHEVEYTEQYPPDTTAAIFWLKNRQPEKWRDVNKHEHAGANGAPLIPVLNVTIGGS